MSSLIGLRGFSEIEPDGYMQPDGDMPPWDCLNRELWAQVDILMSRAIREARDAVETAHRNGRSTFTEELLSKATAHHESADALFRYLTGQVRPTS